MIPTQRAVILTLLAAPVIAASAWLPALIWVAGGYLALVALLLFLDWRAAGDGRHLMVTRHHDARLSLGVENTIQVRIRNRARRPAHVWIRDEPPEEFEIENRLLEGKVAPHGSKVGSYYVRPLRRGDYRFGDLHARWHGPLQLVVRQRRVPAEETVKVYPNLLDVRRYDLLLRRNRLQEMGLRHSRRFGEGTEFERLRDYLPDDDFRRINWKATARRHRPVTVEYQTERSQNVVAVLDTGRMMQSPVARLAKLDYVINAVLLLAYVATGKGDKVGMMAFADQVYHFLKPRHGRGQFYQMLEMLYAIEPQPVEPDYRLALNYLALQQRRRALVVIFTDLSGGASMQSLVAHISVLARNNLPLVVTISDPDVHVAAERVPKSSIEVYQRAAAGRLLDERQVALDRLHRQGVLTLDVPADRLSIAVINRYLELKAKMML